MKFLPSEIIKKKRAGLELSEAEIQFLITGYTKDEIPDYQLSAWLMAVYFNGMSASETLHLTQSILDSGVTMKWPESLGIAVDKHSTGGVGDKTSLILGPIAAAAGVPIPMISGRGLGHTGGTLDKLESIPGFNVNLSIEQFREKVIQHKICFIGQTKEICPADKKLYALRDVTATVESRPLICSSILSKKISEGIGALILDVKFGSGAFMKTFAEAEALCEALTAVANKHGKKVASLITSMEQPLGRFSGNALEVIECLEIMSGKTFHNEEGQDLYDDTRDLSLELSALMIWLGEKAKSLDEARDKAEELLTSGAALEKFEEITKSQGGDFSQMAIPASAAEIRATQDGFVARIDTEKVGIANIHLGAGRAQVSDPVSAYAGIEVCKKIGDPVKKGDTLFKLFVEASGDLNAAQSELSQAVNYSLQNTHAPALIKAVRLP